MSRYSTDAHNVFRGQCWSKMSRCHNSNYLNEYLRHWKKIKRFNVESTCNFKYNCTMKFFSLKYVCIVCEINTVGGAMQQYRYAINFLLRSFGLFWYHYGSNELQCHDSGNRHHYLSWTFWGNVTSSSVIVLWMKCQLFVWNMSILSRQVGVIVSMLLILYCFCSQW